MGSGLSSSLLGQVEPNEFADLQCCLEIPSVPTITDRLYSMPPEIVEEILEKINPAGIGRLALASKYWYAAISGAEFTTEKVFVDYRIIRSPVGRYFRSAKIVINLCGNLPDHLKKLVLVLDGHLKNGKNSKITMPVNLRELEVTISTKTAAYSTSGIKHYDTIRWLHRDEGYARLDNHSLNIELNHQLQILLCQDPIFAKTKFVINHNYKRIEVANIDQLVVMPGVRIEFLAANVTSNDQLQHLSKYANIDVLHIRPMCDIIIPTKIQNLCVSDCTSYIDMSIANPGLTLALINTGPYLLKNIQPIKIISIIMEDESDILPEVSDTNHPKHFEFTPIYKKFTETNGPTNARIKVLDLRNIVTSVIIYIGRARYVRETYHWIRMPQHSKFNTQPDVYIMQPTKYRAFVAWKNGSSSRLFVNPEHDIHVAEKDGDKIVVIG